MHRAFAETVVVVALAVVFDDERKQTSAASRWDFSIALTRREEEEAPQPPLDAADDAAEVEMLRSLAAMA